MLTISTKLAQISAVTRIDDVVALSYDLRQKSRIRVTLESGKEAALFMTRGTILRGGDYLQAENGAIVEVIAADQEINENWLTLEADRVLHDMLLGLGVYVQVLNAPFEPESGAYAQSTGSHHHHDDEAHDHSHSHNHSH
jgi:urease accessory protein